MPCHLQGGTGCPMKWLVSGPHPAVSASVTQQCSLQNQSLLLKELITVCLSQLARESAASAPPTAPKGTAVPATSGPRSANLFSSKGPCVLGEGRRMVGRQALKSSSVAVVHPVWFVNGPSRVPHRELACVSAAATKESLSLEEGRSKAPMDQSTRGGLAVHPALRTLCPLGPGSSLSYPYSSWQKIN